MDIKWQKKPKIKWLVNLLAKKQALEPLLDFLKITEVGSRKKIAEKEKESKMRN